ncbi:hypothetical protein PV10_01804 [Exophiala mesophila]|uniref:Zn(2)-C6 fungal-type domain-containing protein n=1 Tax=Exophiala mesophila TaxID=212818 RepID=A0A0D1ZVU8_EXOME|nr:uncharacterized protein PV10_01804 [Exophiala mesophila]KIV98124.1 hypothetical protein PV10_01804 [Exophiala mesophila]
MSEHNLSEADQNQPRSVVACYVCRKRKVKCSKEYPQCTLCAQTLQTCEYPEKLLRPGPKIGSTQTPRKRKRQGETVQVNASAPRQRIDSPLPPTLAPQDSPSPSRDLAPSPRGHVDLPEPDSPSPRPDIQSLSFIIHPSHDSCSDQRKDGSPGSNKQRSPESHVASSCFALGFNPGLLDHYIDKFFENFTSFRLFRESDFRNLLHQVETHYQCRALIATLLLFATKSDEGTDEDYPVPGISQGRASAKFVSQALKYVDIAIYERADLPMSLPLLQTIILISHYLLTQGVRGRAWRYLRCAVGSAYELNMHLIDADRNWTNDIDPQLWSEDEERRRAWWAIWEMDVFSSVIRRCPTGIDWTQNETFLPADDDNWTRGEPQQSCKLSLDPVGRYKALEACGNQSPKAWFLIINSLMKEAQKITSPMGLDTSFVPDLHVSATATATASDTAKPQDRHGHSYGHRTPSRARESLNQLRIIRNALQCTVMALPPQVKYRYQYLSFGMREIDRQSVITRRLQHSAIYSIHTMVQLTKLMIYKYHLFNQSGDQLLKKDCHHHLARNQALEQYSESADEIVSLVGQSYEEHFRFVNPFTASTIWLGGAVQLLYRELAPLNPSEKAVTNSKLELLRMTYNHFVSFWSMSSTMQKNLEVVETEIHNLRCGGPKAQEQGQDQIRLPPQTDTNARIEADGAGDGHGDVGLHPADDSTVTCTGPFMSTQSIPPPNTRPTWLTGQQLPESATPLTGFLRICPAQTAINSICWDHLCQCPSWVKERPVAAV